MQSSMGISVRYSRLAASASLLMMLLTLLPAHAIAQEASNSYVNVGVVSKNARGKSEKREKKKKTAFTKSTISKKEIRSASPALNIETILNLTPSVNAYSDGPNGMRTDIQFRGFTGYQISQTFDGVPLNDLFNAGSSNYASTRNSIPLILGNISGVNIYRGINNPSVNSLYSLGGTINYLPRQPTNNFGAFLTLGVGSFATQREEALVNTGSLAGFNTLLSFSKDKTNGWQQNTSDTNRNFYLASRKVFSQGLTKVSFYLVENHNSGLTPHTVPVSLINEFGNSYEWPLNWTYSNQNDSHTIALIDLKTAFATNILFSLKTYYLANSYDRLSYTNPNLIPEVAGSAQPYFLPNEPASFAAPGPNNSYNPQTLFGSSYAGTDYHLYINNTSSLGSKPAVVIVLPDNTLTIGANLIYGVLHSAEYWYGTAQVPTQDLYNDAWDERDQRNFLSGFIQDNIALLNGRLHVIPGLKYSHVGTSDADNPGYFYSFGGTASNNENYTSPSLGANYTFGKHMAVYASWGRTFKVPEISAYYGAIGVQNNNGQNVLPSVTVQPEFVRDIELGTRYITRTWDLELNGYREYFQNKFQSYSPQTGQFAGLSLQYNGGTAVYQGVELSAKHNWGEWYAFANYSVNQASYGSFYSPYTSTTAPAAPVANIPHRLVGAGLGWRAAPWDLDFYGNYVGERNAVTAVTGFTSPYVIPSYTVYNFTSSYTFKNLKLSLSVYNLFDKTYFNYAFQNSDINNNPIIQGLIGEPHFVYLQAQVRFL